METKEKKVGSREEVKKEVKPVEKAKTPEVKKGQAKPKAKPKKKILQDTDTIRMPK